ncbi:hypothetical protein [Methylobacterium sp. yr668]|uniref:hypothetical protein n=1 Tax=Methylobacterium sp. yr668 TaxID=1761801 RepID=UPI000AB12A4C|nr:hypothetical protein [Methylobacterium sp. yr668]
MGRHVGGGRNDNFHSDDSCAVVPEFAKYSIHTIMKIMKADTVVMISVFQVAGAWSTWSVGICNSSLSSSESDGRCERSSFSARVSNGHGERGRGSEALHRWPMFSDAVMGYAAPQRSPNYQSDYQSSYR